MKKIIPNPLLCLVLIISLFACDPDKEDCVVMEYHENGNVQGMVCSDKELGIRTGYLFNKEGDTTGIYKYNWEGEIPISYKIYKEGTLHKIYYYDEADTNKVLKHFYKDSMRLWRIEYFINDSPFYFRRIANGAILEFSSDYRIDYNIVEGDSLAHIKVQIPLPDTIINKHRPIYFMHRPANVLDTGNWSEESFDLYFEENTVLDSFEITSSKVYDIYYPINEIKETHIITALSFPKDSSIHNIKNIRIKGR